MPLTHVALKATQPQAKPYKLYDEKGLFLSVEPKGGRLWRLKYRFNGKEKKLSLGAYPETGLKEARDKRDEARRLLAAGVDPGHQKKVEKQTQILRAANTFQAVADEYIAKREREGLAAVTVTKAQWLLRLLAAKIGSRPFAEITAPELLTALRAVESQNKLETARRMRSFAGRVFRHDLATSRCDRNIAADLLGALTAPTVTHRAAILKPAAVGALLRAIEGYTGQPSTALALRLTRSTFPRSVDALRIVQYESCRGLEGWTTILNGFDEFWQTKYDQALAEMGDAGDFSGKSREGAAWARAWRWALIPLTRPIDTLVISFRNRESKPAKLLLEIGARNADFVTRAGWA